MFRTLKSAYETNIGKKLDRSKPLFSWLMLWTATVLNRYQRDGNGRTAYYKQKGKDASKELCNFGEKGPIPATERSKEEQGGKQTKSLHYP